MRQSWRERLTWWWCDHFGHSLYGETLLNNMRICQRCGRAAQG